MAKRKREVTTLQSGAPNSKTRKIAVAKPSPVHIQIIAGSYEKVLHGIIAAVPRQVLQPLETSNVTPKATGKENGTTGKDTADAKEKSKDAEANDNEDLEITFTDTFMFTAHSSAIRCLTLSPVPSPTDSSQKLLLASGSNDERINLYNLSTTPPYDLTSSTSKAKATPQLPSLSGVKVSQNSLNKELGSLDHHNGPVTRLLFPSRSKLLTASEDNTIAIARTRDWTVLSTIKAPVPKTQGRPSGDTFAPGEVPAGVNDFAVHPSMKLMLSVGKGERCMRLWNLVTGKKAGVLSFERSVLDAVGEGKYGTGEGQRIIWDKNGEEFAVAFERGAVVFGIDCAVRSVLSPRPANKVHQMCYVAGLEGNILALSTEDGRILFFDTDAAPSTEEDKHPQAPLIAQLGGRHLGVSSRIKDFVILSQPSAPNLILITASSDGTIRMWSLSTGELEIALEASSAQSSAGKVPQVGHLLAQYETGNRITCLAGFVMNERGAGEDAGEESEFGGFSEGGGAEEDSESESESE